MQKKKGFVFLFTGALVYQPQVGRHASSVKKYCYKNRNIVAI